MLNLDAYKNRDIQNIQAILIQAEVKGITDIRFVRDQLQEHINKAFRKRRMPKAVKERRNSAMQGSRKICPSCGNGVLIAACNVENIRRVRCSKKCGYSEVIA